MVRKDDKNGLIDVPAKNRPNLGARSMPLHIICMRGAEALDAVVRQSIPELDGLSQKLWDAADASSPAPSASDLESLMQCSNDLRGMASTMGSQISADIANAIYELCEAEPAGLSKQLILLLAEAARQMIGYRSENDGGRMKMRIETLLADVREAIASVQ